MAKKSTDKKDYPVGYKKPPRHTQFKKGQSGNPKGRPKGTPNFRTALDREIREQVTVNEGGRRSQISKLEAIVKQFVNKPMAGDVRALELLLRQLPLVDDSFSEAEPEDTLEAADDVIMRRLFERIKHSSKEDSADENDPQ